MTPRVRGLLLALLATACESAPAATDANVRDTGDASADVSVDAGPALLADLRCGAPTPWAEPLRDYLAAGERASMSGNFLRAVQDLAVFEDRLYLGYGDANINLGRVTPIEFRAFTDDARPEATAEFRSDEEQLEQYRLLDGDLWLAGVDAAEDDWIGNVYVRPRAGSDGGSAWVKRRTVPGGVHVHDVAWWRGALWAVGSGSAREEWMRGDIYGHLWRSDDRGRTFTVAARHHNMGAGDARLVRMLPLADAMLLFGYRSDAMGRTTIVNLSWDGTSASPLPMGHPLRAVFMLETALLPGGNGFARGVTNVPGVQGLVHRAFRVATNGTVTPIAHLQGRTVLDVNVYAATGEVLVLSADGDEYAGAPWVWSMRLEVTRDFERFTELAAFDDQDAVRAVAAWRSRVYFGTDRGAVWRCELSPAR